MTNIEIFAFVVLPVTVAALGWLAAWLAVRKAEHDDPRARYFHK